jgi:transcriptional regulator with XRE-family HTH domain
MWTRMSDAGPDAAFRHGRGTGHTIGWSRLVENVAALPEGQLWRHNQAGDLPHVAEEIDHAAVGELVAANARAGARGFTYTHHNPAIGENLHTIRQANISGFTVNLSANNLAHADQLADLEVGPVVTLLPAEISGNRKLETAAGRRVVVCPATYRDDVTCATCGLCAPRGPLRHRRLSRARRRKAQSRRDRGMTRPELLALAGRALYGPQWQKELAKRLFVSSRSVRYWLTGRNAISPATLLDIRTLAKQNIDELQALITTLEDTAFSS